MPDNSVLNFVGGSIIGAVDCTLTLNGCYLEGLPKFDTVDFSGNIKNDLFDATWVVNGSDIGAKINYAQQYFKRLHVPFGTYEFSTPIVVDSAESIYFNAYFTYTGQIANNNSAIRINYATTHNIYIKSLEIDNLNRINYANDRTVNFIGICFNRCNNCCINVDQVNGFNENIRMQGDGGGCAYNKINLLMSLNANIGIRFYQNNGGWSNETAIYGGRFTVAGMGELRTGTLYGIFIGGPKADNASYRDTDNDTLDKSSHITVYEGSFEHLDYIVYARKIDCLSILRPREENVQAGLIEADGKIVNFKYEPGFSYIGYALNLLKTTDFQMNWARTLHIDVSDRSDIVNPENNVFASNTYIHQKWDSPRDIYFMRGVILDTSSMKIFGLGFLGEGNYGRIILKMLNDEGTQQLPMSNTQNAPLNINTYDATHGGFISANVYVVPNNVNKVYVGILSLNGATMKALDVYANVEIKYSFDNYTTGSWADKPGKMKQGLGYYATDLNKMVYYNATANKWFDPSGNEVTG